MKAFWIILVIASILISGTLGFPQDAFADHLSLFHTTFVGSTSFAAQEDSPLDVAFLPYNFSCRLAM